MKMNRPWWAPFAFGVLFTNLPFAGEPSRLEVVPKAAMAATKDEGRPRPGQLTPSTINATIGAYEYGKPLPHYGPRRGDTE